MNHGPTSARVAIPRRLAHQNLIRIALIAFFVSGCESSRDAASTDEVMTSDGGAATTRPTTRPDSRTPLRSESSRESQPESRTTTTREVARELLLSAPPAMRAALPRLMAVMYEGLRQGKPYQVWWSGRRRSVTTSTTAFMGSYDRHSNIAAHWALLVDARLRGDAAAVQDLIGSFDLAGLAAERKFVGDTNAVSPMRPYDQTWLVLFLAELERQAAPDVAAVARSFREDCTALLLAYAEEQVFPPPVETLPEPVTKPASRSSRTPAAPRAPSGWVSGAYPSAVWPVTVLTLTWPTSPEHASRLEALLAGKFAAAADVLKHETPENRFRGGHGYDFFHAGSIAALTERTAAVAPRPGVYGYAPFSAAAAESIPDRLSLSNCHRLGFEITKLWPVAFDAGRGDPDARAILHARLDAYVARKEAWDGPFLTVSHWVPQVLFFAVWLSAGRP